MGSVDVAGCEVGALRRSEWLDRLAAAAAGDRPHHHVSMNAAKWVAMRRDRSLRAAVRGADSVAADGIGIVWASRWLDQPVPERVAGFDLAQGLVERARATGLGVYLLGAAPEVVSAVAERLRSDGVTIVGARHGYFRPDEERAVAEGIGRARPNLLLVALGTPAAELFVHRWREVLRAPLMLGVGGTFDVWAGRATRAPPLAQRWGLEWAWRLAGSPTARFRRAVVDSARFVAHVGLGHRIPDDGEPTPAPPR
ncbi:MAG: WecB/TagA/CpsF family glycosyltransferase [Myxococcota bacterium]